MKMPFMAKTWEDANLKNVFLVGSNFALSCVTAVSVYALLNQHERVVLTPPHLDTAVQVGWNSASAEYLKSYGLYFALLTANVTPKNVSFVIDVLSGALSSRIYPEVRKKLLALSEDPIFRTQGASVRFDPTKVTYEAETNKVFVAGDMATQNAVGRNESRPMVYELVILMKDGKPVIDGLNSYEGSDPHTLRWLETHATPTPKEQSK